MTPEQKFWQWLRPHLPGDMVRLENTTGNGFPDVNVCVNGIETWIELKVFEDYFKIRKWQNVWGRRRSAQGGRVFVVIQMPKHDLVAVFRHPVTTEKLNETYQKLTGTPVVFNSKRNIKELIEYLTL